MPTYSIERCLDRLPSVEVYSGQMTRTSGSTHRVSFQVVVGSEAPDLEGLLAQGRGLARVAHPAVPRVRDVFVVDGCAVWVTDEVEGRSLAHLIQERPVPSRAAFEVGAQVAGALEAIHAGIDRATGNPLRLRHEALEPSVVWVDRYGVVKLLGIGAGRGNVGLGQAPSPERLLAQEEGIESEVFALAALLVQAMGQTAMFEGQDADALHGLMVDPNALRTATTHHLETLRDRIGTERGVALLRAMTAARKGERPTMAQVAARCDLISDSIDTPPLTEFARARVPAVPRVSLEGSFAGRTVTTETPSLWSISETPPVPPPRSSGPRKAPTPLPPAPTRPPVLGERQNVPDAEVVEVAAFSDQGPMPWSDAETLALFEKTPSLAPPRELQPIVVNPNRIPQLIRQQWDDGVARRYRLAQMAEQLVEEPVDEDTPTLVVRDEPSPPEPSPSTAPNRPDVDPLAETDPAEPAEPFAAEPTYAEAPVEDPPAPAHYDAPEVSQAGAGRPQPYIPAPSLPSFTESDGVRSETVVGRLKETEQSPPVTPPAFPVPPGLESLIADEASTPGTQDSAPPAPMFQSGAPSPTVVPLTTADDVILGSDHGEFPDAGRPTSGGVPVSLIAAVVMGVFLGAAGGAMLLYYFYAVAEQV
ncbi:MAG: hypothetical protein AAGA48_33745 [Myxococcota bacterium]